MGTTRKKKKKRQNDRLVLRLLILVAGAIFIFEGRLIYTMFTHSTADSAVTVSAGSGQTASAGTKEPSASSASDSQPASGTSASADGSGTSIDEPLAGLSIAASSGLVTNPDQEPVDDGRISESIDSPAVVQKQETPVDDSFFADSVFIGDSRMMGFRNSSGITQGDFLTSVGLSTEAMSDQVIATAEGTISVYQGLSGKQYDKIYLMLGTNDLGYYPWENFEPNFLNIVQQFHKLQPDATIYVCSVIYVNEALVSASYNNNDNVRKVNGYQLDVCEQEDYCYYLNLNEIFTNGYGALMENASSDGIHLYEEYCKQMLSYLKNHYVPETGTESKKESETETETASENIVIEE